MQTFLPYASFARSAAVLDRQRLGKQRVEVMQILNALRVDNPKRGWRNHPAVRMWAGYQNALATYGLDICHEWTKRGYKDTCAFRIELLIQTGPFESETLLDPWWLGDENVHASHRSNLLRKDPDWYSRWGWDEPDDMEYVWPTRGVT